MAYIKLDIDHSSGDNKSLQWGWYIMDNDYNDLQEKIELIRINYLSIPAWIRLGCFFILDDTIQLGPYKLKIVSQSKSLDGCYLCTLEETIE